MTKKAKNNRAHHISESKKTSTPGHKRPSRERGPFGESNGTVQKEHIKKDEK